VTYHSSRKLHNIWSTLEHCLSEGWNAYSLFSELHARSNTQDAGRQVLTSKRSDHHQSWWQYWNHYHMNQIIPWKLQVAQEHGWSSIILNPSNQCNREWHFTKWFTYNWGRSGDDEEKNTYGPAPEEGGLSTTRSRGYWAASAASIRGVLGLSISMRRESQMNLHNQVVQWSLGLTLKHHRKQISGLTKPIIPRTPAHHVNSHAETPLSQSQHNLINPFYQHQDGIPISIYQEPQRQTSNWCIETWWIITMQQSFQRDSNCAIKHYNNLWKCNADCLSEFNIS